MRSGREILAGKVARSRAVASASNEAVFAAMDRTSATHFFAHRGLSATTIQILTANGIALPEEVLFLPMTYLTGLPGLTAAGLNEIQDNRRRFPPPQEEETLQR